MKRILRNSANSERGFVLVVAILAAMVLMAVGVYALTLTTQDLRIGTQYLAEKRASAAAESAIHDMLDTTVLDSGNANYLKNKTDVHVDTVNDPRTIYSIKKLTRLNSYTPMGGDKSGGGSPDKGGLTTVSPSEHSTFSADIEGTHQGYGNTFRIEVRAMERQGH